MRQLSGARPRYHRAAVIAAALHYMSMRLTLYNMEMQSDAPARRRRSVACIPLHILPFKVALRFTGVFMKDYGSP